MRILWPRARAAMREDAQAPQVPRQRPSALAQPHITRYTFCGHNACSRGAGAVAAAARREAERLNLNLDLDHTLTVCDGFCHSGPFVGVPELSLFYQGVLPGEVRTMLQETSLRGRPLFHRLYLDPTVVTDSRVAFERHQGILVVIEADYCLVETVTYLFEFNAAESCGKCFPCRLGVQRMAQILRGFLSGQATAEDLEELTALTLAMDQASYCQFAGRITAPVRLALKSARSEFERHLATQGCRPGERHIRPRANL